MVNGFDDSISVQDVRTEGTVRELLIEKTPFTAFEPADGKF